MSSTVTKRGSISGRKAKSRAANPRQTKPRPNAPRTPTNGATPGETDERESIGYLSRYAYRAFVRALAVELARHGILTGQWSVLRVLWEREGPSQVELADLMRVEKASLTGTLDGMARQGLIVRTRNKQDRRKVNIHLTAKGRRLKARLLPYAGKINRRATKGMSPVDIATLRRLLSSVTENLDR